MQVSVVFQIGLGPFEGNLVVGSLKRGRLSDAKRTVGMSCNLKDGLLCAVGQVSRVRRCENSIDIEIHRLPSAESFAVSGTRPSGWARQRGSRRGDNRGRLQMERRTGFSWNVERGNADSRSRVVWAQKTARYKTKERGKRWIDGSNDVAASVQFAMRQKRSRCRSGDMWRGGPVPKA